MNENRKACTGLAARHKSRTKLIMGPWVHGIGTRASGDVDFGPAAEVDLVADQERWFDQIMKGKSTGILEEPPVRLFIMGGGSGTRGTDERLEEGRAVVCHHGLAPASGLFPG